MLCNLLMWKNEDQGRNSYKSEKYKTMLFQDSILNPETTPSLVGMNHFPKILKIEHVHKEGKRQDAVKFLLFKFHVFNVNVLL